MAFIWYTLSCSCFSSRAHSFVHLDAETLKENRCDGTFFVINWQFRPCNQWMLAEMLQQQQKQPFHFPVTPNCKYIKLSICIVRPCAPALVRHGPIYYYCIILCCICFTRAALFARCENAARATVAAVVTHTMERVEKSIVLFHFHLPFLCSVCSTHIIHLLTHTHPGAGTRYWIYASIYTEDAHRTQGARQAAVVQPKTEKPKWIP